MKEPSEKQKIKEQATREIDSVASDARPDRVVAKINLTEKDRNAFASCLATGTPYSKTYGRPSALKLVLRDKKLSEINEIARALDRGLDDGRISNWQEYKHFYNLFSLYFQTESINGIAQVRETTGKGGAGATDLFSSFSSSPISEFTSSQVYVALSFLVRFNTEVAKLIEEAADPENFSLPATGSK